MARQELVSGRRLCSAQSMEKQAKRLWRNGIEIRYSSNGTGYIMNASNFRYKENRYSREEIKQYFAADIESLVSLIQGYKTKYSRNFRMVGKQGDVQLYKLGDQVADDLQNQIKFLQGSLKNSDELLFKGKNRE